MSRRTWGLGGLGVLALVTVFAWGGAGCQGSCEGAPTTEVSGKTVRVFAAASLTDVLEDLAEAFRATHPTFGVRVVLGGSQVLRLQIEQGAKADLFMSAHRQHIDALTASGKIVRAEPMASNALAVAVPADNPLGLNDLSELGRVERIVVGSEGVPLGLYTQQLLQRIEGAGHGELRAQLEARIVSREHNARLVRAKVALGEADAAIVYRTDIRPGAHVSAIEIPAAFNVASTYVLASLHRPESEDAVRAFRAFVTSPRGRAIFTQHGFGLP